MYHPQTASDRLTLLSRLGRSEGATVIGDPLCWRWRRVRSPPPLCCSDAVCLFPKSPRLVPSSFVGLRLCSALSHFCARPSRRLLRSSRFNYHLGPWVVATMRNHCTHECISPPLSSSPSFVLDSVQEFC